MNDREKELDIREKALDDRENDNDDLTQKLLIDILDQSTAYWSGFLYERTETIVAQDAGDFLVTSAFGFQK